MVTEADYKRAFAKQMLAPGADSFSIALKLFPHESHVPFALWAGKEWPKDLEVLQYQREMIDDPFAAGILTDRHQTAALVLEKAKKTHDPDSFGRLVTVYAKIMQFIDMPVAASTNIQINNNKVIQVPASMDMQQWEHVAIAHQERLIDGGTSGLITERSRP